MVHPRICLRNDSWRLVARTALGDGSDGLPRVPTVEAWGSGLEYLTDDRAWWDPLWQSNRAVAEAYGLSPADLRHILSSFPAFAKKRPEFFQWMIERVGEWEG